MAQAIVTRGATGGPQLTGDATNGNVLEGKTFYNDSTKTKEVGTLPKTAVLEDNGGTIGVYRWSVSVINS